MSNDAIYSTMIRAGRTTFFIDVKEARNGSKYISISEHRNDGEEKRQRSTIRVFGETIGQFKQAINEAYDSVQQ